MAYTPMPYPTVLYDTTGHAVFVSGSATAATLPVAYGALPASVPSVAQQAQIRVFLHPQTSVLTILPVSGLAIQRSREER